MNRYDEEEKHEAYVKSPEYAAEQKRVAEKKAQDEENKKDELQDTLAEMDLEKAMEQAETHGTSLAQKQLNAAQNDEYLQNLFKKFAEDGTDGIRVIKKEKALQAAALVVKKFRNLEGQDNKDYLTANFDEKWNEQDVKGSGVIDVTEAYTMLNEL